MKEQKRDFKGIWIDRDIWLDDDLTIMEKIFYVEIDSLDGKDGCYANNEYFAKFFGISKDRASSVINSLYKKGRITLKLDRIAENKDRRILKIIHGGYRRKRREGIGENADTGIGENAEHNNININNTNNNIAEASSAEVQNIIDLFKPVNPSFAKLFANTTQRTAVKRMLKVHGYEKLVDMVNALTKVNEIEYMPKSTTPLQLEDNMGRIKAKIGEQKTKNNIGVVKV